MKRMAACTGATAAGFTKSKAEDARATRSQRTVASMRLKLGATISKRRSKLGNPSSYAGWLSVETAGFQKWRLAAMTAKLGMTLRLLNLEPS